MQLRPVVPSILRYIAAIMFSVMTCSLWGGERQPLTPQACVGIRYLAPDEFTNRPPMAISPDGMNVAYVVEAPDIQANTNHFELYVAPLDADAGAEQHPILVNSQIAAIHWFSDNRHLAALIREQNKIVLTRIDSVTGRYSVIWEDAGDITDYSMSDDGKTIAVAVRVADTSQESSQLGREDEHGHRLDFQTPSVPNRPRRRVSILTGVDSEHWTTAQNVTFRSPLSGNEITDITDSHSMHINLSPDGRYLLLDNIEEFGGITLPKTWRSSKVVSFLDGWFDGLIVNYLYDTKTKTASMPLQSPVVRHTTWAPDSRSFASVALAPVGSSWETRDLSKGKPSDHSTHLFAVDVTTGEVSELLERADRAPLGWTLDAGIVTRDQSGRIRYFQRTTEQWTATKTLQVPLSDLSSHGTLVTNGVRVVGEYERADIAPQIFEYQSPSKIVKVIAKLNPQGDNLVLPKSEKISWTTSTGYRATGLLLLPPDYNPKHRYPLVVEDGSILYSGGFVCDSGPDHVSSFARGILADSEIMYLMRSWPGIDNWENNFFPTGYPGLVAEAAFKMDLVESAVRYLNARDMIDPTKVGLIGFSRGGWYAEYALAHSSISFAAATATDNVLYSFGEYWNSHNDEVMRGDDALYGGPPYGATLRDWLDYSISFNVDRIHTPLLMEVMGYGLKDDNPQTLPANLAAAGEIVEGLRKLNRPVELYYYPDEQHQPDHPQARIASLQRNVDWYRFWLQGYERLDLKDRQQYRHWELMRKERNSDGTPGSSRDQRDGAN
jgi:dipeptidyl aminopeptidase/acylaminoacyl peptidase